MNVLPEMLNKFKSNFKLITLSGKLIQLGAYKVSQLAVSSTYW